MTYSNFKNKDWLYQKIASNITPAPTGLKIKELLKEEGSIFLIDIPQSMNPPHQCCCDGRYYIRMETEAKPAPHGLVQALFSKRRKPQLDVELDIIPYDKLMDNIRISFKNETNVPADSFQYIVEIHGIKKVESDFDFKFIKDQYLGDHYCLSDKTDGLLVKFLCFPLEFKVKHNSKAYIITVTFWSKEIELKGQYWVYSPNETRTIQSGEIFESNSQYIDELLKITL